MKKFFAILLTVMMLLPLAGLVASADSDELLTNPTFADGKETWVTSGTGTVIEEDSESQDDDDCSLLVSSRTVAHAAMAINLVQTVQEYGNGEYTGSIWVKLADSEDEPVKLAMVFQLTWMVGDEKKQEWALGTYETVKADGWVNLSKTIDISDAAAMTEVKFYFYQDTKYTEYPDILVDNCSFKKLGTVITPAPTVLAATAAPASAITRPDSTRIGAIRWDAFYKTNGSAANVSDQVAKALSPAKYHWTAPYFSIVNSDNTISFPEYTMDIWEEEADYAIDAGLDYFAYVWYETTDAMSAARKYHVQSAKHDQIKMCGILGASGFSGKTISELYDAMKEDYYLQIDGMPILYYYDAVNGASTDKIKEIRNQAATAGVEKPIYMVAMVSGNTVSIAQAKQVSAMGFDAISFYSTGATKADMKYTELAEICEQRNSKAGAYSDFISTIPSMTFGRDTRARIENPVSWAGDYEGKYAASGTAAEIAQHAKNVLEWTRNNAGATVANCTLGYAWNEHDEGGWLCPTLKVDAQGNVLKDANGKAQRNTEILDAFKAVVKEYRTNEKNPVLTTTAPAKSTVTSAPGVTEGPKDESEFNVLYVIIPVAVAGLAGGAFVFLKKKNKKGE